MRTITRHTDVYRFYELSDDAKRKAIEDLYDINVSSDWWDATYYDAENIGCKIHEFDADRNNDIRLTCDDARKTAGLILENHGEMCDTYKLAEQYRKDFDALTQDEGGELLHQDELDAEFTRALGEEYLSILRQEYEYLTSEEAIIETIEANEYEFTEDGKLS